MSKREMRNNPMAELAKQFAEGGEKDTVEQQQGGESKEGQQVVNGEDAQEATPATPLAEQEIGDNRLGSAIKNLHQTVAKKKKEKNVAVTIYLTPDNLKRFNKATPDKGAKSELINGLLNIYFDELELLKKAEQDANKDK